MDACSFYGNYLPAGYLFNIYFRTSILGYADKDICFNLFVGVGKKIRQP